MRRASFRAHLSRGLLRRPAGLIGVGLAGLAIGLTAACGGAEPSAGSVPSLRSPEPAASHRGDISPRRLTGNTDTPDSTPTPTRTPTPTPTITMTPLPQPSKTYPAPEMPKEPKETDPELDRITYRLKTIVWASAGEVEEKQTTSTCSKSENDIIRVGSYKFTCDVKLSGVQTRFDISATVKESEVKWTWTADELPVTEKKAVYEATRQAFRPARVTCDVVDLELVKVGAQTGLTCWVTDVYNKQVSYRGKLLPTGALAFSPDA
jgi:hypothetical protein